MSLAGARNGGFGGYGAAGFPERDREREGFGERMAGIFHSVVSIAHLNLSGRFLLLALVVCLTTVEDSSSGVF